MGNRMGWRLAVVLAVGLLAAPVLWAQGPCPTDDPKVARVDIKITRNASAVTLAVSPDPVTIYLHDGPDRTRRVCWAVTGMAEDETLIFDSKDEDGDSFFPGHPKRIRGQHPSANSGNAAKAGDWSYGLRLRDAEGKSLSYLDPVVIIKGDA